MKFLFIEPFYGGSHRDFADGLKLWSQHHIDLVTLPARFWKWRMRGAALYLAKSIQLPLDYDGVIVTNLMSLVDLKMVWGTSCPPVLLYFHDNQLNYPLAPGEQRDYQYGFTDITSALSADRILFNSTTHLQSFFNSLTIFLKKMPEYVPKWVKDAIRLKCKVAYPGCHFEGDLSEVPFEKEDKTTPPLIIWNHRWEYDKNPEEFFWALDTIDKMGMAFKLVLLGERYQRAPEIFKWALEHFKNDIIHCGYEENKRDYHGWLKQGSLVVSTAHQENFGVSVIEAIRFGCLPLVPNRLVYPEIIPKKFRNRVLYVNKQDLVNKLVIELKENNQQDDLRKRLSSAMASFAWAECIEGYDTILEDLANFRGQL